MVAQHHIHTQAKLGDIAEIHGIRRVAFAQHGVTMLVEGHCRKAFGQSVGNHLLSRAWEELDHLGGDGLANPIPASVNVSRGFSIDRILSHANDSTRIFIEFGGSCLEYATFSIRRFNIIVICPRCLIQSYSSLGVAAPKHFRAWKATANRTDFAAQSVILISVTHLLRLMFITISARD